MARRGPAPKPTRLKALAGNPGKRPLNRHEPQPKPGLPRCPAQLSEEAKREWKRISKELDRLGLLTVLDRAALSAYCQAWGRWIEAEERLRQHGVIVKSPSGFPVQSPYLSVANKAMAQMSKLLVEFGLSPSRNRDSPVARRNSPRRQKGNGNGSPRTSTGSVC